MREPHLYPCVHVHALLWTRAKKCRFSHGHPVKGSILESQTPRDAPSHTHTVTLEVSCAYTDACLHTPHSYMQLAAHK